MQMKLWQKNILSMLAIIVGGFILFNIAFMLAAIVINSISYLTGTQGKPPYIGMPVYLIIILLISWFVFKSKLNDLVKAIYLTLPLMIVLVLDGMLLFTQPQWLILLVGAVIVGAVLYYIYKKKLSWLYYFATLYVTVLALCIMIFNIEI